MQGKQVIFTEPNKVELKDIDFNLDNLGPKDVAVHTRYSLISAGTELACLSGKESWAKLPFAPGYAGCGEVIGVGKEVKDLKAGDLVFSYTKHASHVKASTVTVPVPKGVDLKLVPFARMAAVSISALRVSNADLGDYVAVLGLGLVGSLCAQLFALSGCEVIGSDVSPRRIELARKCGLKHAVNPSQQDAKAAVKEITGGRMCEVVVEATGNPAVGATAGGLAGKLGEVILLGSPRGEHPCDLTQVLNYIHLWGNGCVTFKGAHEWRYPIERDPGGHMKHSIRRNVEILLRLIGDGRLRVNELITQVLPPTECAKAYAGLREKKEEYVGVVFDWT